MKNLQSSFDVLTLQSLYCVIILCRYTVHVSIGFDVLTSCQCTLKTGVRRKIAFELLFLVDLYAFTKIMKTHKY